MKLLILQALGTPRLAVDEDAAELGSNTSGDWDDSFALGGAVKAWHGRYCLPKCAWFSWGLHCTCSGMLLLPKSHCSACQQHAFDIVYIYNF